LPSDKLTELGLRKAKPSSKPKKLSDGGGLFILLHPSGSKYWRMKYRFMGKEKLLAFGVWPEVSLTEARKKRNEAKQLLKSGKDPSAAKKNLKASQKVAQSNTFGSVTEHVKNCDAVVSCLGHVMNLKGFLVSQKAMHRRDT
jgi:hypothetical protein